MHVGFVSQYVYPHDEEIRITKFAETLVSAGHRVTVFSRAEAVSPDAEERGAVVIRRFRLVRGLPWLQRLLTSTLPFNGLWIAWLWRAFRQGPVDVVVVRNLRLALPTIVAARLRGIPVVMDLGENHPALVVALGKQCLAHYAIRNPHLVAWLERTCVRRADHIWVVAEANRRRLEGLLPVGGRHQRISLVRNVPRVTGFADLGGFTERRAKDRVGRIRLLYLGIVDNLRGLEMVLEALVLLDARGEPIDLVVAGDGPERAQLERLTYQLGLQRRVTFRGWVAGYAREAELRGADVGLIPHRVCHLTETTQPNKLFDYMLAALPVLSTPLGPVREVIEEVGCGVVAAYSAEAFAAAVQALRADVEGRATMGERGRRAVLERYNWEVESEQALASLARVVHS